MQRKSMLKQLNSIQKSIDSMEKEHRKGHFEPRRSKREPRVTAPIEPITTGKINPDTGEIDYDKPMDKGSFDKPVPDRYASNPQSRTDEEGMTSPATGSTKMGASAAARRNRAAEDEETDPERFNPKNRKPPFQMEYADDMETEEMESRIAAKPRNRPTYPLRDRSNMKRTSSRKEWEGRQDPGRRKPEQGASPLSAMEKEDESYSRMSGGIPQHVKTKSKSTADIARGKERRQGPERVVVSNKPTSEPERNFDMMRKAIETSLLKLMQYGKL